MSAAVPNPRMSTIVDDLVARSNGRFDVEFVRILVANVATEFEGARVQDYLEVLVAKQAADELRRLDALHHVAS